MNANQYRRWLIPKENDDSYTEAVGLLAGFLAVVP